MRTDDLYLVDLIEAAEAIERMLRGRDYATFAGDDTLRSAVLWKLYVMSEAASKLSADSRDRFADVPWNEIRAFRNRMAHGYFTLDWGKVWEIATQSLPALRSQAETALAAMFPAVSRILQERRLRGPAGNNA